MRKGAIHEKPLHFREGMRLATMQTKVNRGGRGFSCKRTSFQCSFLKKRHL